MYFKAEIVHASELYVNNDRDQGCDPLSYADSGVINTLTDPNLDKLKESIVDQYGEIEHFEANRYEAGYESMERNGVYVSNMISIYITSVKEEEVQFDK